MARKTFSFTPQPADQDAGRISQTGREVLRKTRDDGVVAMDNAKLVRIERLVPNPDQPRKTIDPHYLARLADSIRHYGVLTPITAKYRVEDETFLIIAGEQRWRAAQQAGLDEVPVVVRNSSATDRYVESCMENLVRADLTEVEKGEALEELKRLLPRTWEGMAAMLGLTRRRVDQMRQLTTIRPPLQEAVRSRTISGRHARQLDLLPDHLQEPALAAVVDAGLNVRQVEEVVRRLRAAPDAAPPGEPPPPAPGAGAEAAVGDAGSLPAAGAVASAEAAPRSQDAERGGLAPHPEVAPDAPTRDGPVAGATAAQVAVVIAEVLAAEGDPSPHQRHSVPVVRKLTMIERALRGIPLHSVGDEDRAEVLARLGRIHEVLAQMERVLG